MDECCKDEFKGKCCCSCAHHIKDFYHCSTGSIKMIGESCLCNQPKGYVCALRLSEGIVYSGWTEHGLCEMWSSAFLASITSKMIIE